MEGTRIALLINKSRVLQAATPTQHHTLDMKEFS